VFTGLVEEVGQVVEAIPTDGGRTLRIAAERVREGLQVGDSVAVNGACLTVISLEAGSFTVQCVPTTIARTTLGDFQPGRRVNLERALAVGQRLGGHLVQGHVDGVGEILSVIPHGEHVLIQVTLPPLVEEVTILHGSVTVDGVSLTIDDLAAGTLQLSIIPHTWEVTTLADLLPGASVNLEGDLIGKYVRHLLGRPGADMRSTEHLLRDWGY